MHRVQTLKEDARIQSGLNPAIPIPDCPVPIPNRVANLSNDEDDVATKILLNFINGKKFGPNVPPKAQSVRRLPAKPRAKVKKEKQQQQQRVVKTEAAATNKIAETETVGLRKRRNRVKLYVCGICSAQFQDKDSFMSHCQQLHVLPTVPFVTPPKQSIEAKLGPENVAEKAMKQLAILMKREDTEPEAKKETVTGNFSEHVDDDVMVELIPVPDYEDGEEEDELHNCIEVEIIPDIDVVEPKLTQPAQTFPENSIKQEPNQDPIVPANGDETNASVAAEQSDVAMDTFVITTIKKEPTKTTKTVQKEPDTAKTPEVVKAVVDLPATRSRAIKAVSVPTTRSNTPKPIFVPSKPTTRSSQKLTTPVRKSLRSAKKQRAS